VPELWELLTAARSRSHPSPQGHSLGRFSSEVRE
jgi:hypothetical protein